MKRQDMRLEAVYIFTALSFVALAAQVIPAYLTAAGEKIAILIGYYINKTSTGMEVIYAVIFLISPILFLIFGCISILTKNLNYSVLSLFFLINYLTISGGTGAKDFYIYLPLMVSTAVYVSGVGMLRHISEGHLQEKQLLRRLAELRTKPIFFDKETFILKKEYSWSKGKIHAKKYLTSVIKLLMFTLCIYFIITAPKIIVSTLPMLNNWLISNESFKQPLLNSFALFIILTTIVVTVRIMVKISDYIYVVSNQKDALIMRSIIDFTAGVSDNTPEKLLNSEIKFINNPSNLIFYIVDMNYYLWLFLICALLLAGISVSWDQATFKQAALQVVTNTPEYAEPETYLNKINQWLIQQEEKIGTLNLDEFIIKINSVVGGM